MELTCPKCHGAMRTYERNGVHVDQCADCRGIFLDRGELERLVDAENAWHGDPRAEKRQDDDRDRDPEHRASGSDFGGVVSDVLSQVRGGRQSTSGHGYPKRKKESFLGDLFG
jgi:Zn-finger nucleic acid-binding protein